MLIWRKLYFRVCYQKMDHLKALCLSSYLDIICIVESWLSADIADEELGLQNYSITRLDKN